MKKTFIILLIISSGLLKAQSNSFFTILQYYRDLTVNSVTPISDNGFILTGTALIQNQDILILKLDQFGNYEWSKFIGFYDELTDSYTNDEGFRIVDLPEESAFLVLASTLDKKSIIMLKIDYNSNVLVQKKISVGYNLGFNIYSVSQTEFYITGTYAEINDLSFGRPFVIKINSSMDVVWKKDFRYHAWSESVGEIHTSCIKSDGSFLLAGIIKENNLSNDQYLFLANINAQGEIIWDQQYNLLVNQATNVSIHAIGENYSVIYNDKESMKICNIDGSGNILNNKAILLDGIKYPFNFINDQTNIYAVSSPKITNSGFYLLKLQNQSETIEKDSFQPTQYYIFNTKYMTADDDSSHIICGELTNPDEGFSGIFMIKKDKNSKTSFDPTLSFMDGPIATNIKSDIKLKIIIKNYLTYFEIENNSDRNSHFNIIDISGKKQLTGNLNKKSNMRISTENLCKGFYFIEVYNSTFHIKQKFIKE